MRRVRMALWIAAALAALPVSAALWRGAPTAPLPALSIVGEADIRSEFSLVDHTGRPVTQADFAQHWQLVFFGFTHCPDVCPMTLLYLADVIDHLGEQAERVAPLFITVDPARDTVPVMAEYAAAFHPRLVGLTGTEAQVAEAAASFRAWYEVSEDPAAPDGYFLAHAGHLYLMRPDGSFEAAFLEGSQPPEALAAEILGVIGKDG